MSPTPEAPSGTVILACPVCGTPVTFHIRQARITAEIYGLGADVEAVAEHHCAWARP